MGCSGWRGKCGLENRLLRKKYGVRRNPGMRHVALQYLKDIQMRTGQQKRQAEGDSQLVG